MRMSWSRNEARAATHLVKVRGESERQNGRTQYWYASPRKQTSGTSCNEEEWIRGSILSIVTSQSSDLIWDTISLIMSILNKTRLIARFSKCRSIIGRTPPHPNNPFLERLINGYRTLILSQEEEHILWPPSTKECLLLVPIPEPAWGPLV